MAQTAAQRKRRQRARDRARLGNEQYKKIEAEKMRRYRASKRPPPPAQPPAQPPPAQPPQQPQAVKPSTKNQKKQKAPQQLQRPQQQAVKDFVP
jgi:hypothetical protein